jgi:hypothetical protein
MLCLILIVGGLLIMMGRHSRSEALFYYFRLEDQVPETHLLRLIDTFFLECLVNRHVCLLYSVDYCLQVGRSGNRAPRSPAGGRSFSTAEIINAHLVRVIVARCPHPRDFPSCKVPRIGLG